MNRRRSQAGRWNLAVDHPARLDRGIAAIDIRLTSDLDSTVDLVWDPIRNDSGFQRLLTGKAALKYRDKLDHWCARDSTGRTNSEHLDSFPAAGPPLTTDWDFVLDFGIRRRDHWKADAERVFGGNSRSLAANHPKEEG